jgi:regulator of sigma E protease
MEIMVLGGLPGFAIKTLAFLFLLGVLVIIHEYGHYIMSKRGGVPVQEFSIGFGPVVAKLFQQGETAFNLRALPLGGFVRTVGMEPGDDAPDGYNMKPIWTRTKIIAAGALINLLFGFLLFVALGMTTGLPSEEAAIVKVGEVNAGSPAAVSGLKTGDTFISINGESIKTPERLVDVIQKNANKPLAIVVQRAGQDVPITATPKPVTDSGKTVGRLGFAPQADSLWIRHGLLGSVVAGAKRSYGMSVDILEALKTKSTWTKRELGGPIFIAKATGAMVDQGLKYYLWFMAMFSINLGVLNLLPLPVLDGGHLVLLAIEAVRKRKPSEQFVMAFQSVGMVVLAAFFIFIMASDVMRLLGKG